MDKLLSALKRNRHGHRNWLIGLIIYHHGLRVSEACDLRWDDIDLPKRTIIVRRLKGSTDSVHYRRGMGERSQAPAPAAAGGRDHTTERLAALVDEDVRPLGHWAHD
jgi:integrase